MIHSKRFIPGMIALVLFLNGCTWATSAARADSPAQVDSPAPSAAAAIVPPADAAPATATMTATSSATIPPAPTATNTPTPSSIGPSFAPNIDPLTGLPVTDPNLLERRPLAIKVSNFPPDLRPHSGMSFADLVFHYYTEEGMTRFLAIYLGTDSPRTGPIRSARMVDAQLTVLYQSILGFMGGDPTILNEIYGRLANRAVTGMPSTCPGVCPGPGGDVNSVFADTKALTAFALSHGISEGRQNLDGMVFDPVAPSGGTALNTLHVQYNFQNRSEWRFDPATGRNIRYIETWDENGVVLQGNKPKLIPLTDRDNKQTISSANTVVLFARYWPLPGNEKYEIEFWALKQGRALLFRDGQLFEGTWNVTQIDAPLIFRDAQGKPLAFKPGNTWFEIVGEKSILTGPKDGRLDVLFEIP